MIKILIYMTLVVALAEASNIRKEKQLKYIPIRKLKYLNPNDKSYVKDFKHISKLKFIVNHGLDNLNYSLKDKFDFEIQRSATISVKENKKLYYVIYDITNDCNYIKFIVNKENFEILEYYTTQRHCFERRR